VELHHLRAAAMRRVDLPELRVDEGADDDLRAVKLARHLAQPRHVPRDIEAAFGRDFLPVLGHEADLMRLEAQRLRDHRAGGGHFEIERNAQRAAEFAHIAFLDVAAVFTQVHRDLRGTRLLGQQGDPNDVRFGWQSALPATVTRLAQGGDVIDVESKLGHDGKR
jgi:hypothetical protein